MMEKEDRQGFGMVSNGRTRQGRQPRQLPPYNTSIVTEWGYLSNLSRLPSKLFFIGNGGVK